MSANAEPRTDTSEEVEQRFQTLVQSPLRSGLLRFLSANQNESFTLDALMQSFGRMRLDIENCMRELVTFGVAERTERAGEESFAFQMPVSDATRTLVEAFLQRRVPVSAEES